MSTLMDMIVECIREQGRASRVEIQRELPSLKVEQINRTLSKATAQGWVRKVGSFDPERGGSPIPIYVATDRKGRPAALIKEVVRVVEELGRGDADDVAAHIPTHTRLQVIKALQNAARLGSIEKVALSDKVSRGCARMAVYAATGAEERMEDEPLPPRGKYGYIGKVSSVFAMAAGLGA